jgi:hypothetical protein
MKPNSPETGPENPFAFPLCVSGLHFDFATRKKKLESLETGEGNKGEEEGSEGQQHIEQAEFRCMQEFFYQGLTLTEALTEIKQLPAFQLHKPTKKQEKDLMRKLIRARDSVAPFMEMINQVKAMPEEALPLPVFDNDTRMATALFELAAKQSGGKSFPVPVSAVAHLLDCPGKEAWRTIKDLIAIPVIKLARKGRGNQSACYKLIAIDAAEDHSLDL